MAVSVAPLTTAVMGSVDRDRAGTASGINNAVARIAGLLAIAILGIVMVRNFSSSLNRDLASRIPSGMLQYFQSNASKLAGLDVPAGLDASTATMIRASISAAFISAFRLEMLICAALCLASSVVAWKMIPAERQQPSRDIPAAKIRASI